MQNKIIIEEALKEGGSIIMARKDQMRAWLRGEMWINYCDNYYKYNGHDNTNKVFLLNVNDSQDCLRIRYENIITDVENYHFVYTN